MGRIILMVLVWGFVSSAWGEDAMLARMELEIKIDKVSDEAFKVANARVTKLLKQTSLYKELREQGDYPIEELPGRIRASEDVLRRMRLSEDKSPQLKLMRRLQRLREQFVLEAWREEFGKRLKSLKIDLSPKRRRALEKRYKISA